MIAYYKTCNKKDLANAYGYAFAWNFMRRFQREIKRTPLTAEQKKKLGDYQKKELLLPKQVEVFVEVLGTPSKRQLLLNSE